jgi:hypothetical protein
LRKYARGGGDGRCGSPGGDNGASRLVDHRRSP